MRKIKYLILILFLLPGISKADIIYYPHEGFGPALSLEGIGSFEFPFTHQNTINLWGGLGAVAMVEAIGKPAYGAEMAIEMRHYFNNKNYENFNLGLYMGLAYMKYPYFYRGNYIDSRKSVGFVPGLKFTYKKQINSWLIGEPYIGLSMPWYIENLDNLFNFSFKNYIYQLKFTIGFRVGFNKIIKKEFHSK